MARVDVQRAIIGARSAECPGCRSTEALAKFATFVSDRAGVLLVECRCNEKTGGCGQRWRRLDHTN